MRGRVRPLRTDRGSERESAAITYRGSERESVAITYRGSERESAAITGVALITGLVFACDTTKILFLQIP